MLIMYPDGMNLNIYLFSNQNMFSNDTRTHPDIYFYPFNYPLFKIYRFISLRSRLDPALLIISIIIFMLIIRF